MPAVVAACHLCHAQAAQEAPHRVRPGVDNVIASLTPVKHKSCWLSSGFDLVVARSELKQGLLR